jgi:phosphopantothenoylcysteine decarboxylase/phosphopantothenate--cysteine ligase
VRFIGNRSSGKMGAAIAASAQRRGANVTLIAGAMDVDPPAGVAVMRAMTADDMYKAVDSVFAQADLLVMSAAVGDYHVKDRAGGKVKKTEGWALSLEPNPDILKEMGKRKNGQTLVGFAAETDEPEKHGIEKLTAKNLDMVVINDVSRSDIGFNSDYNEVTIITKSGQTRRVSRSLKSHIAEEILDLAVSIRDAGSGERA